MNNKTWLEICEIQRRNKIMNIYEIKQILEGAEESKINPENVIVRNNGLRKEYYTLPDETHSLSDLKTILEQHQRIEELESAIRETQINCINYFDSMDCDDEEDQASCFDKLNESLINNEALI